MCHFDSSVVPGIDMAHHTRRRIVGEDSFELLGGKVAAVGDRDLSGVDRPTDPDSSAVMEAHPGRTRACIDEPIEKRPVGNGVGTIGHALSFSVRRGDGA